ncbi:Uncharacterized protein APZ42_031518 [Daphnia magna]|uniref:Uncharacterized protein n=1 Tax=Daphnia magna TaxID=35525 RepID=A0A164MT29_9CRUS|nr:Uncharacterized protein APZ42_031518 [Daphnia magna]
MISTCSCDCSARAVSTRARCIANSGAREVRIITSRKTEVRSFHHSKINWVHIGKDQQGISREKGPIGSTHTEEWVRLQRGIGIGDACHRIPMLP